MQMMMMKLKNQPGNSSISNDPNERSNLITIYWLLIMIIMLATKSLQKFLQLFLGLINESNLITDSVYNWKLYRTILKRNDDGKYAEIPIPSIGVINASETLCDNSIII